ncbi:glypican-5-like [Osmerus mordax]|uniref:glypican-5-like n=1 Tax=Osmerus mordax TaxID=8014 RepID=UPI003510ACF0
MFRGVWPRVSILWILSTVLFFAKVEDVDSYSCHEVKTAFQMRQIGPLKWVPEVPGTDVDLLVCKHQGPSCCTRKMEDSYQAAVRRETLQNIHSYSSELKYLISGHAIAFQDTFQYLLSFSQGHLSSLLESSFPSLSRRALPHVNRLFSTLSLFLRGSDVDVEASVHRFYDDLFPLVYTRLVNPGSASEGTVDRLDCLRMTRQDIDPFGPHPAALALELGRALGAGRALALALEEGVEVVNATEHVGLSRECARGLVKMQYCSHCRGLTLIKPCAGYCLNVLRGCLASVAELDQPWRRYMAVLEDLTHAIAGQHSLELALLGVRDQVNEAILHAQLNGSLITTTVDKVCGPSVEKTTSSTHQTGPGDTITSSTVTSSSPPTSTPPSLPPPEQLMGQLANFRSSLPLKPSKNHNPRSLKKISREFLVYIKRYKSVFGTLPEMLCEGEMVVDDFNCWSGDGVVESYTGRVVGKGLQAQKQNPEVKVRSPNPVLAEVKKKLEGFTQEIQERMPGLGERETWGDLGSGETEEGSGDCDDEDGCQGSGDHADRTAHTEVSSDGRPRASDPARASPGAKAPPVVRVRGDAASPAWLHLGLLLACLALPWSL